MEPRSRLVERVLDQVRQIGVDVDELSVATASHLHLNRTDLRALQLLRASSGLTAGELARALHVTTGATTRVIDSLVASGHAQREWDPVDRRRILVRITPAAERALEASTELLRVDTRRLLEGYQPDQLELLGSFLAEVRELVRAHARRLSRPS